MPMLDCEMKQDGGEMEETCKTPKGDGEILRPATRLQNSLLQAATSVLLRPEFLAA
jgi:hypothetical protein